MAIFYGVVEDDPLDSGGRVIDGESNWRIEGEDGRLRGMTFLGQNAWCDVCHSAGKIVAAPGSPDTHRMLDLTSGNRRQALGGDLVFCKCERHPRIVAAHARSMKIIDDGGGAVGLAAAAATAATMASTATPSTVTPSAPLPSFDDRFVLRDYTGKPVPFVEYAIKREGGELERGKTDAQGHTHLLEQTRVTEHVCIYVESEE